MTMRLLLSFVAVTTLVALVTGHAWPRRSQAWYECCCDRINPDCGSCFVCRSQRYGCDCNSCSCYPEDRTGPVMSKQQQHQQQQHDIQSQQDLLEFLLRGGFGGRRFKKNNDLFDEDQLDGESFQWQES